MYGATVWGVNSLAGGWGYGYSYSNPYYVAPATSVVPVYDYAQPIVVNNYNETNLDVASEASAESEPVEVLSPEEEVAYDAFDQARAEFKLQNYANALKLSEEAIRKSPNDPVLHEFYALVLFALRKYDQAAVVLNSLLAVAPGMDWTTMSSLYDSSETYTTHLRLLEEHVSSNPQDASALFVLAYHYMVLDEIDAAVETLKQVVELKPGDLVAKRMLTSMDDSAPEEIPEPPVDTENTENTEDTEPQPEDEVTTDILGSWQAKNNGVTIDLQVGEDGEFVWKVTQEGEAAAEIKGPFELAGEVLVLDGGDQGSMVGRVTSRTADQFGFQLLEAPDDDPGLVFDRQ